VRDFAVHDPCLGNRIQTLALHNRQKGGAGQSIYAAKSSVSHAIDGHKVVGNGIVPSLPVNSSRVLPEFRDAASAEFHPVILSLHSAPNLAARPPPIKAHFAS
jgi:hypothetical protein